MPMGQICIQLPTRVAIFVLEILAGNQEITMVRKPIIAISGYTISTVHSPLNPSLAGVLTFNDQLGRGSQSGLVLGVDIQLPAPNGKILALSQAGPARSWSD